VNDPAFGFYLQCWQYTKLWGSLEWRYWPLDILDGMTAIESASNEVEKEEMDKIRSQT